MSLQDTLTLWQWVFGIVAAGVFLMALTNPPDE
jgi:hypothetical protein